MVGTSPTFFKIPVTQVLSNNICNGSYPEAITAVTFYSVDVPRPDHWFNEGMRPLDNRREVLRCYQAFREIVGI